VKLVERAEPVAVKVMTSTVYTVEGDDSFQLSIDNEGATPVIELMMNNNNGMCLYSDEAREVACCLLALADEIDAR